MRLAIHCKPAVTVAAWLVHYVYQTIGSLRPNGRTVISCWRSKTLWSPASFSPEDAARGVLLTPQDAPIAPHACNAEPILNLSCPHVHALNTSLLRFHGGG